MEEKLMRYRAEQERQNKIERFRDKLKSLIFFILPHKTKSNEVIKNEEKPNKLKSSVKSTVLKKRKMDLSDDDAPLITSDDTMSVDEESLLDDSITCCSWLQLLHYFLYFLLWVTIYMIFIKLQFGTVYLILSALLFMYLNTKTTPRKSGEVSAYSVFNKDCVSIDGTLKAEQFEREIMFGAGSVR